MKRLYLEQQKIPIDLLTDEQNANLRDHWPCRYVVRRVIGATTPKIHNYLTEDQVGRYCNDDEWQVEIT